MPGARHGGRRLAQRRLVRGDQARLPEVTVDQRLELGMAEQVEHLERHRRRVRREDTPALLDPVAAEHALGQQVRAELLVEALVALLTGQETIAGEERAVDPLGERQRRVAVDQAADEYAAV